MAWQQELEEGRALDKAKENVVKSKGMRVHVDPKSNTVNGEAPDDLLELYQQLRRRQ